jgi:DNA modification methylase
MTEKSIFRALPDDAQFKAIEEITPYERNARRHPKKQIRKLADAIRVVGWGPSVIIDENDLLLAGHARLEAAKLLGLPHVPVEVRSGLTDHEKRMLILGDNRLHDESSYDVKLLKMELEDLSLSRFKLESTGFDPLEIDRILSLDDQDPNEDEEVVNVPDEGSPVVSQLGDYWSVGEHGLYHGDARMQASYERLLSGQLAQLVFSDPPYGCKIENNVSGLGKKKHSDFLLGAGEESLEEFGTNLLLPALRCMAANALPGALAFIFTDWRASPYLHTAASKVFFEQKNLIVWSKTNAGMGSCYRSAHELIHLYKISAGKHVNNFGLGGEGGRHRCNVWTYPGANTFRKGRMEDLEAHSTVKPRKLVEDAIIDTTRRGEVVLDPFVGSGTTLAAAQVTGRRGFGIELDGKYVDVALRRLAEVVGKPPMLDGKTPFDEVAAARHSKDVGGAA